MSKPKNTNFTSEWLFQKLRIYDIEGYTKVRLGNKGDGGYVVLDELCRDSAVLYSYGVADDISFEKDWNSRYPNTNIRLFDHTVYGIDMPNSKFSFTKEGLEGGLRCKTTPPHAKEMNSVKAHLEQFGEDYDIRKTLKFDIEGGEWWAFGSSGNENASILHLFDQVICEFHIFPVLYKDSHSPYFTSLMKDVYWKANWSVFQDYISGMWSFTNHFIPYHIHINNSLPLVNVDGFVMPQLIEVSMINTNLVKGRRLAAGPFPDPVLDFPNKTDRPDITNFKWGWDHA